jgi:hypothetical protein
MTTALAVSGGGQELYELLQLLEIVAWACKAMQNHHDARMVLGGGSSSWWRCSKQEARGAAVGVRKLMGIE